MRTNNINGLELAKPQNLLANLQAVNVVQTAPIPPVWPALAEIGRQLQKLAEAQSGQGSFQLPPALPRNRIRLPLYR